MAKNDQEDGRDIKREADLFRAITDNARDSIFCKDRDLRYTFVNPAMARLFGCQVEDLIGRTPNELFEELDAVKVAEADGPVLRGEVTDLVRELTLDGRRRFFHTVQVPIRGEDEEVTGICGIVRDITLRRQAELALKESESIVSSFYENSMVMMGVMELTEDDIELRSVNGAFASFLGLDRQAAPGIRLAALETSPFALGLWVAKLRESELHGVPVQFEQEQPERCLLASVSFIGRYEAIRPRFSCVVSDISHRKAAELERDELEKQLRRSQKMDAVGLLAGGVAHDFNNLLTAILGFTDVLEEQLVDSPALADVEEIRQAGETASALTEQLLAFSRRQMIAPRKLVLNEVVSRSERMLRRLIGENLDLKVALEPTLWAVQIDPAQADRLVVNLVANARDAMPRSGTVTVRTRNVVLEDRLCRGCGENFDGEHVLLEISDTGEGMSATTVARVFEPFFTTKPKGKGTGLGLATVHGIVHQHEGHLDVSSVVNEGTRFQLFFPRSRSEETVRVDSGQLPRVGGEERVLVAEDQGIVRRLVVRKLTDSGYQVVAAEDGAKALRLAEEIEGGPELLITDVVMPNVNGKELYDRLKERWPEVRVLFMSGYSDDVIAKHGVMDPDLPFLQKPFKIKDLLRKVREALDLYPASSAPDR